MTGLTEGQVDQLARGTRVRVVWQVPDLPGCVRVLAQDGKSLADVANVGIAVRLIRVTQNAGRGVGEDGREDRVAEVGLGATAWPEVVLRASDGDLDPSGLVSREQLQGHLRTVSPPGPASGCPRRPRAEPVCGDATARGRSQLLVRVVCKPSSGLADEPRRRWYGRDDVGVAPFVVRTGVN